MAKKDENQGVQCENADFEIMRRQLARLEKMLTDKFTEVNDRIGNIAVQQPAFPPPAEPQQPQTKEVFIPDNLASRDDIRALSGIIQTLNGTVSLVMKSLAEMQKAFAAMPRPDVDAIVQQVADKAAQEMARKVVDDLTPKIDDSASKAIRMGAVKSPGITLDDAASIHRTLKETNERISVRDNVDKLSRLNRKLLLSLFLSMFVVLGLGCRIFDLRKERGEMLGVEWLYRCLRSTLNKSDTTTLYNLEQTILSGSKEQRESLQTTIVNNEATGIPFNNFQPHDNWKPEPPKPQAAEPKQTQKTEIDRFPLPHQRERRLTPGEVAAIKAMRTDPNIPDDAKPELPDGYE